MGSVARESTSVEARRGNRERGQALVEFALILPLFLMIVVGIIQFGVALNYWLDLQRVASQGARWAAVNCGQSATSPSGDPCAPTIEQALREEIISSGNDPEVDVCWKQAELEPGSEAGPPKAGDSVRVTLKTEYAFLGITSFFGGDALSLDLNADAAMRIEVAPTSSTLDEVVPCE